MESQEVYQTDAYNMTIEKTGKLFARDYFAQPREIETWKDNRFQLVDGWAWYEVRYIKAVPHKHPDLYRIYKLA